MLVWDRLLRGARRGRGDPWVTLAAMATATERIRLGPMVTPLARRLPAKVSRETATLDRLSGGRLTLGVGLGSDRFGGDFSVTGEELDERRRARMLDESLEILTAAWSGELVRHRGEHYTIEGMRFLPRPVQRPGVPMWVAGSYGRPRPLRRAARYQGFVPVDLEHPDQLAEMVADLAALRREAGIAATEPYDIVAALAIGTHPSPTAPPVRPGGWPSLRLTPFSVDRVHAVIRDGPIAPVSGDSSPPRPIVTPKSRLKSLPADACHRHDIAGQCSPPNRPSCPDRRGRGKQLELSL